MSDVLIVGDDLTGSNGTANGMVRLGLRAGTIRAGADQSDRAARISPYREEFDALVVTTDSRHLSPAHAASLTREAVRAGWPARLVASRCDSTLRGNVGPQAEAVLRTVEELSGAETIGLCAPAFPTADRQTLAGLQLMGGKRLEHTELARDVRSPMTTSSVEELLTRDADLTCAHIGIAAVTAGGSTLRDALAAALASRPDVLIADAYTEAHLAAVAEAAADVRPEAMWVSIDPGPGTWALAEALGLTRGHGTADTADGRAGESAHTTVPEAPTGSSRPDHRRPAHDPAAPLLAVSGSATELTRLQLSHLRRTRTCEVVRARYRPGTRFLDEDATAEAVAAAFAALASRGAQGRMDGAPASAPVVLLATVLDETDLLDLTHEEGDALPTALGAIAARVLAVTAVRGLYTTGGDITTAVLDHVDGVGIEVRGEVVPLAAAGTVVGGAHHGMPIVTKGGLVGAADTAAVCLDAVEALSA